MKSPLFTNSIILVLLALVFITCKQQADLQIDLPINYLALGDSYTIGHGVEAAQSWPNQLSEKLEENGYAVEKTTIIAKTGWQTSDLLTAIADTVLMDYNLVSLLIGVNNQFWGQPFEIFNTEFDSLLHKAIALGGGKENVFVLSIPDYGVTPFGSNNRQRIALKIDQYNAYIKQKCIEEAILFVDVTTISRTLGDSEGALAVDNLHPSGSQYAKWVEVTLPKVKGILGE